MSRAWPVNENGSPVSSAASQVTVVVPCAKWAWRWPTSGASSSLSASATAWSSSLTLTFLGPDQKLRRFRMASPRAITAARARPRGRLRAVRHRAGRNGRRCRGRQRCSGSVSEEVSGRYRGRARMASTTGCRSERSRSSIGLMTNSRRGTPARSTRSTSLAMKVSETRGYPIST